VELLAVFEKSAKCDGSTTVQEYCIYAPQHQINHNNVFYLTVLTNVTLASSNSALPEDGDYTQTCWRRFNP